MGIEDVFKGGNVVTGLAIGVGAAVIGPIVMPVVRGIAKPVAKAAIRGGLSLYDRGREMAAEFGEMAQDLVAETKAEMAGEDFADEEGKPALRHEGAHGRQAKGPEAKPSHNA